MLSAACLIGTVLLTSRLVASPALAVYSLSFWHYLFYWWAYRYGAVRPARFRRDAILMKSVALTALASAWLVQPWHWGPALTIGTGFILNLAGARALGHTATFYGWELGELGELPQQRVTRFPYSVVPHPMLAGNIIAFGGTLLHPGFRRSWWPLAVVHVALNIALIVMETSVAPRRRVGARSAAWAMTTVVGVTLAAGGVALLTLPPPAGETPTGGTPVAIAVAVAVVVIASIAYGYAQRGWYVPAARSQEVAYE
jgi:protein-S-isoprenylcysteine O-methyltransferase Ste14